MARNPQFDVPEDDVWMGGPRGMQPTLRTVLASPAEPQPPTPPTPPFAPATGWTPQDDGLVARMYADRQNRYNPAVHGQPQGTPHGNTVVVPPQDAAEQVTPMTVALSARATLQVKGAGGATLRVEGPAIDTAVAPADDFAEAAAEAASNPDPAVEQAIFEYGAKEIEPPAAGAALHGQSTVAVDTQVAKPRPRRMRTAAGRSVQANNVTIILSVASLVLLIDEKLASLRDQRPNDPDALDCRDEAIAHYEGVKHDLEALRNVAIEVGHGRGDEKAVTKATSTFSECVRKWWNKRYDDICTKAWDASLFVSCVSICSLTGCGGATAVAVSGALVGGKPVIDALKALPKRLHKEHDQ
jgi:hypothetical protein